MTDWRIAAATKAYRNSLIATESIDPPSVGFTKPVTGAGLTTLLKQNNTIIQLLVSVSEKLEDLQTEVTRLKKEVTEKGKTPVTTENLDPILEEIQKKLESFHIGEQKSKKKSPFFVFKDPLKIYETERQK